MRQQSRLTVATFALGALLLLGLATGAVSHVDSDQGGSPLYWHIADLSANGMAARAWNVTEQAPPVSPDGSRYYDMTYGQATCTTSDQCTNGPVCTHGPVWCTSAVEPKSWGSIKELFLEQ